jgi:hypothetical protein
VPRSNSAGSRSAGWPVSRAGRSRGLKLEIYPDQAEYIPANVEAEIAATTVFGAKFVDLIYPNDPARSIFGRVRCCSRAMCPPR